MLFPRDVQQNKRQKDHVETNEPKPHGTAKVSRRCRRRWSSRFTPRRQRPVCRPPTNGSTEPFVDDVPKPHGQGAFDRRIWGRRGVCRGVNRAILGDVGGSGTAGVPGRSGKGVINQKAFQGFRSGHAPSPGQTYLVDLRPGTTAGTAASAWTERADCPTKKAYVYAHR